MILSIILPTILSVLLEYKGPTYSTILNIIILFISCFIISAFFDFIVYILQGNKAKSTSYMLQAINIIGKQFTLGDQDTMYTVLKSDISESIVSEPRSKIDGFAYRILHPFHYVFFSIAANDYINWVEFSNLIFLRILHDKLGCHIIIFVQLNDRSRETGLFSKPDESLYNEQVRITREYINCIIGADVRILVEDQFHDMYANVYADEFHEPFVSALIDFSKDVELGNCSFPQFMRHISYLESTYPIMALMKKKSYIGRIYILDRTYAFQTWKLSIFSKLCEKFKLKFIRIKTFVNSEGQPISFSNGKETLNISDNFNEIRRKFDLMDEDTKQNILYLLTDVLKSSGLENCMADLPDNPRDRLILLISILKGKYTIVA